MMYDILKEEFQLGWIDADGLKPYVGWNVITQDQFNTIVNPATTSSAAPQSAATVQPTVTPTSNATN